MAAGSRPSARKTRDIIGLPVVCLAEGRVVGHVRQIVFDPEQGSVVGMVVSTGGILSPGRLLALQEIHSVGDDAVTVQTTTSLLAPARTAQARDLKRSADRRPLYGMHVITDAGTSLGRVDDIVVDFRTGVICEYILSEGLFADMFRGRASLPASAVKTIGDDAIVVHDLEAERPPEQGPAGPPDTEKEAVTPAAPDQPASSFGSAPPGRSPRPVPVRQHRLKVFRAPVRPMPPGPRRR